MSFQSNTARVLAALSFCSIAAPLHAATIKVPAHQPTIAAAIEVAGIGDKIVISEGVYHENLMMVFKEDVTVKGKGKVVIDGSGGEAGFVVGLSTDVTVEGLTFRNATELQLGFGSCVGSRVKDCRFEGGVGDGLRIDKGIDAEIIDCDFENIPGSAVTLTTNSAYLGGCVIKNCGQVDDAPAVRLIGGFLTAESNVIKDDGVGHGIAVGFSGEITHHALISNNKISNAGWDGIFLDDAEECMVSGNSIKNSGDDGLSLYSGSNANYVDNNRISGSGTDGIDALGDANVVTRNRIKKSEHAGIGVYLASTDGYWFKNKVKSSDVGLTVYGSDNAFIKNSAKGSKNYDFVDQAAPNANDYVGNVFPKVDS